MLIKNGRVFMDGQFRSADVILEDGKIRSIGLGLSYDGQVIDAAGKLVFPGFIDVHCHGGFEVSCGDGADAMRKICARYPENGVTSFFPTLAPHNVEMAQRSVQGVKDAMGCPGTDIVGIHFEGPYFSPHNHASHYGPAATNPSPEHTTAMVDGDLDIISMVCVAPELPGAMEYISWARSHGIIIELGYTLATSGQIKEAADRGATQISHLFNGFPKMNHRVDGAVVGCLLEDRLYAQLTVDGVHVLPPFIRLAIKNKGIDHVLGITDGSEYMGKPEGRYIGKTGEEYEIKDGMARDLTGMLLAGTHTFDSVMRTALSMGLTLEEVGRMYAENPAISMGITDRGKIALGRKGDIVIMDEGLHVEKTIIDGQIFYEAK
ncbi:amidohydrolase family protein [Christensenella sp. MSJ-20]|uniref:N-acetylglucosamine-6-phosphate deacetylase n=1 Tax=Christensenella sp. MSJ-20 TaxID=2841518 RepID=UPI001C75CDC9|nr:amidohydrolase family protein [Christensenella sp. MSJ-20]